MAVGSIVRSKGGIALQSTLNLTAGTLLAAAQVCPGPAQLWLLHGMWLIVNSAGPAFLPHVSVWTFPSGSQARASQIHKICCVGAQLFIHINVTIAHSRNPVYLTVICLR